MLCGQYLRQVTLTERDSTQYSIMNEIAEYIKHNYTQDLKLQQVARVLGYDYYYCSRLFRKTFGDIPILLTGLEDPECAAHGENESLYVPDFEHGIVAETLFFAGICS